jgi:hypothetical protein
MIKYLESNMKNTSDRLSWKVLEAFDSLSRLVLD